jgi:hypothetical protein
MHVLLIADRDAKTELSRALQGELSALLVSQAPAPIVYSRSHASRSHGSFCLR